MKSIKLSITRERKPYDNVIVVRTQTAKNETGMVRSVRIHCFSEQQLSAFKVTSDNTICKNKS